MQRLMALSAVHVLHKCARQATLRNDFIIRMPISCVFLVIAQPFALFPCVSRHHSGNHAWAAIAFEATFPRSVLWSRLRAVSGPAPVAPMWAVFWVHVVEVAVSAVCGESTMYLLDLEALLAANV